MKLIKNTISLILIMTLFSCTKNNVEMENSDTLIGEWKLSKIKVNGKDTTNECNTRAIVKFNSDGTLTSAFYDYLRGACASNRLNGSWKKNNNNYSIDFGYDYDRTVINISFSNDNIKLIVTERIESNYIFVSTFERK